MMRKADYTLLASLIWQARKVAAGPTTRDFQERIALDEQTERIARKFADYASVNKTEFLKACGIE